MAEQTETVSGVLKIEVPSPALALTLTFEKSDDGDQWNPERIAAAVAERGADDVSLEEIAAFFRDAVAADSAYSLTIREGTPPELPAPDQIAWNEALTLPEEMTEIRDMVLRDASAPEFTRDVKETVTREKEVPRKGLLGIGQPKTEKVRYQETVTRTEKIYIDPTIIECWFVQANDLLGTFSTGTPGAPGSDIFGKPVPAKRIADPRYYLGGNLARKGDEVVATETGFLRVGRNWADIVAYAQHRWSVELSPDQATCFLNITPGHPGDAAPQGTDILHAATQLPYPEESLMSAEELDAMVEKQIEAGEEARIPISSSRDASFDIVVSEDKLQALLYIHKGKGRGKHLNLKEVGAAIKASKLKGLDFKKIGDDIKAFYNSGEFDLTGYLLAEGTAPAPGPDRAIEFSLSFEPDAAVQGHREAIEAAPPEDKPDSVEDFPPEAIQKTAQMDAERLVATIDPETPGESGTDVFGATIPGPAGKTPVVHLYENLQHKDPVIIATAAGVLDYAEIDGEYHLRVRPHRDARVQVEIAPNKMTAYLSLRQGAGTGRRIDADMVHEAIEAAGVTVGIDHDVVSKAIEAVLSGVDVDDAPFARGTEAIDQSENILEVLVESTGESAVRIRSDGTADYRTRNDIVTVKKDTKLCRVLPSQQEPIDGTTVTGETVAARTVTGLELELGENVRREEQDDGSVLILSETEGEFIRDKHRIDVRTTRTIKGDVDMTVGNIKFPGTVNIGGTVRSGFYVVSAGDIRIAGGVEGALLSSDGDILINQGVKGAGKAVLRSKRNIMSPFVELATVLSVGDVVLKSAAVRSRIKSNGKITFQGDKGRIVGGTIRAKDGIEATSVGSPRGVKTQISFGQDYLIADLIEKEEKEIEKVKYRISQLDIEMRKAEKTGVEDKLHDLRREKVKTLKLMEKRGLRLFTLRERFEQHFPSKVIVNGEVHSGTIFESHGRTYEVTSPRKGIQVEFDPNTGNLDISDLNGS